MRTKLGSGGVLLAGLIALPVSASLVLFFDRQAEGRTTLYPENKATVAALRGRWEAEPDGSSIFRQHCAICHGSEGRGDGPAAAGIRPPPANFTDPERVGDLTFDDMAKTVAAGKGFMPSFAAVLNPEEIQEVVSYIRTLVADEDGH